MASIAAQTADTLIERPFSNYKPTDWDHEYLMKTLKNQYKEEAYTKTAAALQDDVRHIIDDLYTRTDSMALLELIGDIQRLGLGHIFEKDIHRVLSSLVENKFEAVGSLYATSVYFRIFRLNGFPVSEDAFTIFQDPQGEFKEHLTKDIKGLLSLYEASYLAVEGEKILDKAKIFARMHLIDCEQNMNPLLYDQVKQALALPSHFNHDRLEARWYIDVYSRKNNANLTLLECAKLDYNMLQGAYQEELVAISTRWEALGVRDRLPSTRDNLVEAFTWVFGMNDKPEDKYFREAMTNIICFLTIIDDVYDNYATLDEAQLFTDAVERWDINELDELPEYMRALFFVVYNTVNEMAYKTLKEQGFNTLPHLKKMWLVVFNGYLLELKWFKTGYKPTLKEYLKNSYRSITLPMLYAYSYLFMSPNPTTEILDYIDSTPNIVLQSTYIVRLVDDLATYKHEAERGDTPKAIELYMINEGVTEDVAQKYIANMVEEAWKSFNAEMLSASPLPKAIVKVILDTHKITHVFYQYEDGYGHLKYQDGYGHRGKDMEKRMLTLFFDSIPM